MPCKIDKIRDICKKNITLIEDTAWGCGAKFKDKYLGTWGDIGAFSFDFAKQLLREKGACYFLNLKKNFSLLKLGTIMDMKNNPNFPR